MFNDNRIPSLNAIRSFVSVARHLSFTKAAQELHVTTGAVSRSVRELERELGLPLFKRTGNLLELTSAGVAYHTQIGDLFDRIAAATRAVRKVQNNNVLTIAAPPTFTMQWLIPRLPAFQSEHPNILIDLVIRDFTQEELDFTDKRFELVISCGDGNWPDADTMLLAKEELGAFCSPSLLNSAKPILTLNDLLSYPFLVHSTRPDSWHEYFRLLGATSYPTLPLVGYEHFFMIIEAACAGMGLALLPTIFAEKSVSDGTLVQAYQKTMHNEKGYYLIHPRNEGTSKKIHLFKRWLAKEFEKRVFLT